MLKNIVKWQHRSLCEESVPKILAKYIDNGGGGLVSEFMLDIQYLTQIKETKSIPGKFSGKSGIVHFAKVSQVPPSYSILQHNGRVTTSKLVPRNLRYCETTLVMKERRGLDSKFM